MQSVTRHALIARSARSVVSKIASCVVCRYRALAQAAATPTACEGSAPALEVAAPDGYRFVVVDEDAAGPCPITQVCLHVSDLQKSLGACSLAGRGKGGGAGRGGKGASSTTAPPWRLHTLL